MRRYSYGLDLISNNRELLQGDYLSSSSDIVPRGVDVPMYKNTREYEKALAIDVFRLFDPDYGEKMMDYDYNPYKPIPEPDITHTFTTTREYSENEKEDIYRGLEILRQTKQLNKYQQSETFKQKAIDLDIYMFEFEHVNKEGKK